VVTIVSNVLEPHFPTTVLVREHSDVREINAGVISVIDKLYVDFVSTERNAATNGDSTTMGGYQTEAGMAFLDFDDPRVAQLKAEIVLPAVEHYLTEVYSVNPLFTPFTVKSWANRLSRGDWQAPHMHPKEYTIISGVYYVDVPTAPAPSGHIEFINPNLASVSLGGQIATRRHEPKTGQILLFPPYYMHFVHPLQGGSSRDVVAFDVSLDDRR
jgi:hypothetical protein